MRFIKSETGRYKKTGWYSSFRHAKERCSNVNHKYYYRYGGRGIKFLLTYQEVLALWIRDRACNLKCPSLDRKNTNGHYTFENCQFIEKCENCSKTNRKKLAMSYIKGSRIKLAHA